jgi:hypothetical protein
MSISADKLSLTALAQPDGKLRIMSSSWEDPLVILPGKFLALQWSERLSGPMSRSVSKLRLSLASPLVR